MREHHVRLARELLGLSQGGLAELLDVARGTINRWERGNLRPSEGQSDLLRAFLRATRHNELLALAAQRARQSRGYAYALYHLLCLAFEGLP